MRRTGGGLPGWRLAPLSSEPPRGERAPTLPPPRPAACRGRRRNQSGETHGGVKGGRGQTGSGRRRTVGQEGKEDAEGWSGGHVGSTCAGPVVGVYFDGALLDGVSVGGAVQAAVTHGVQVAAICPKTRRRYRGGRGRHRVSRTGISTDVPGSLTCRRG